ncbi:MAG: transposase [Sedimentisphaeraceae bacterium JB056]
MQSEKYPQRRSVRLKDFDYSENGKYFITICSQYHFSLFGKIERHEIKLNEIGFMIQRWWLALGKRFELGIEPYIIMPNHIHGIITITSGNQISDKSGESKIYYKSEETGENIVSPLHSRTLGQYVSWFKRMSTNEYIRNVKNNNWQPFHKRLWQRSFWERIIRNQRELDNMSDYIYNNPKNWEIDKLCDTNCY